ncbi:hypothetical protein SAY86_005132 [Trapa natans]|uniref:Protein RIK n=1 Tax=Trapa natans TaxID=22666 RepID=A0AAN7L2X6_TRANT|nr:hypothetical protein SAY86_005132 [Trapa natans]
MTEDGGAGLSSDESQKRQRKKRKWDQPAEPLVSGGPAASGILPLGNLDSLQGIVVPGLGASIPSTYLTGLVAPNGVTMYPGIPAPSVPQPISAANPKLNQVKIQEEIVIAREIVINDAEPSLRFRLTKRQTQEEIQKSTGAVVITRGRYRPPNAPSGGEKPLYLHISAGAHLKDTADRVIAVDRAAAMIEDMLKQGPSFVPGSYLPMSNSMKVNQLLSVCVYLGFDADPSLNIAARIRGPNDQYISHIMNETGATVSLRGRGAGAESTNEDVGGEQPLHIFLSSNNPKSLEDAKCLAENLLDTISIECGAPRASSSSNIYGTVPPPQQLLSVTQSIGLEHEESRDASAFGTSHAGPSVQAVSSTQFVPVINNLSTLMPLTQPGILLGNGLSGGNYSWTPPMSGTRYTGYEGIYPQATPLQQVAMVLKQSPAFTSSSVPALTLPSTIVKPSPNSAAEKEKEKQPPQKRKFQELPVSHNVPAKLNQVIFSDLSS